MAPDSAPASRGQVVVVLGTRPEIIKLGHLIRLLGPRVTIAHTGQHFDVGLSQTFFDAFSLPEPAAVLGVGGETRGEQIGHATAALDALLREMRPGAVVVQGDTNSAVAGAIAANATEAPLVHVEAGLRSFDRRMPEEHNRVLADHLSDLCAAPTEVNRTNLLEEGIDPARIRVTGNTIVEAVTSLLPTAERRADLLDAHGLTRDGFVLSTFHRPENVDSPEVLATILSELASLDLPVVLPVHPRTAARIAADPAATAAAKRLTLTDPLGYEEFLGLAAEAAFLVSDSGGIQEEASVLKRPVLVVRRSTERPEVIGTFARRIEPDGGIAGAVTAWLGDPAAVHDELAGIASPYGDGSASRQIVAAIDEVLDA